MIVWNEKLFLWRCIVLVFTLILLVGLSSVLLASCSILLNGTPFGLIKPTRWLRQGDPIAPFLFIIGSEILSRILMCAEADHLLHGICIARTAPPITHLLFADDLLLFTHANVSEAQVVMQCLSKYASWSGQHLNVRKSTVTFSRNTRPAAKIDICSILQLRNSANPGKHLGVPLLIGLNKRQVFSDLVDNIKHRIEGRWKAKLLSQARMRMNNPSKFQNQSTINRPHLPNAKTANRFWETNEAPRFGSLVVPFVILKAPPKAHEHRIQVRTQGFRQQIIRQ